MSKKWYDPEVEYDQNNGTLAVRPAATGRLKSLIKQASGGYDRTWVFKDVPVYRDNDGDERICHHLRGVVVGTYDEGMKFLAMCKEIGLIVTNAGMFVPFSNGERREGSSLRPKYEYNMTDFQECELKVMRWDLPTRAQLLEILKSAE